jgi:hypothetical protein
MNLAMQVLEAHVKGGRLVLDEPTDLPEGEVVELVPVDEVAMDDDERERLDAALELSVSQRASGQLVDADEVIRKLLARGDEGWSSLRKRSSRPTRWTLWWRVHRPNALGLFARELAAVRESIAGTPTLGVRYRTRSGKVRSADPDVVDSHPRLLRGRRRADMVVVLAVWGAPRRRGPRL